MSASGDELRQLALRGQLRARRGPRAAPARCRRGRAARRPPPRRRSGVDLAALDVGDPVLGDREPHRHRALAQLDVVLLRAGEVLQQVAELLGRDDPQVDARSRCGSGPGAPSRPGLPASAISGCSARRAASARRLARGGDQVDVLAGLGPAPRRAGDLDLVGGGVLAQRRRPAPRRPRSTSESRRRSPAPSVAEPLERRRARSPRPSRPRPLTSRSSPLLGRLAQLLERGDPELVVEPPRGLRAEAGDPRHLDRVAGNFSFSFTAGRDLALVEQRDDLLLERLADPRQLGRPALAAPARRPRRGLSRIARAASCRRGRGSGWRRRARRAIAELLEGGGDLGVAHARNVAPSGVRC